MTNGLHPERRLLDQCQSFAHFERGLDRLIPGAFQQLVADADTVFNVELPSLQEWRFMREDAHRITQPVLGVLGAESASIWPGWKEVQERLREWLPQTEPFVLAGANHALEERDPRSVADAMAPFLARHRMPASEATTASVASNACVSAAALQHHTERFGVVKWLEARWLTQRRRLQRGLGIDSGGHGGTD